MNGPQHATPQFPEVSVPVMTVNSWSSHVVCPVSSFLFHHLFFLSVSRDFLTAEDKEGVFNADHFPLWYKRAAEQVPGTFVYSLPFNTGRYTCPLCDNITEQSSFDSLNTQSNLVQLLHPLSTGEMT